MAFRKQVLSTVIYRLAVFLLALISSVITYRGLGPEKRGLLTYVTFILGLIASFADLGTGSSAVVLVGNKELPLREAKRAIQTLAAATIAFFWGVTLYYFWFHVGIAAKAYGHVRELMLIIIPFAVFSRLWENIVYAENRVTVLNRSYVVIQLVSVFLLGIGYFGRILSLPFVFFTVFISHVIQAVYLFIASRPVFEFGCDIKALKKMIRLGLSGYAGNLANYGNYRISYYFIANALGASPLAIFSLATLLSEKILDVTNAASTVLFPQIAHAKEENRLRDRTERILRLNVLLTTGFCLTMAVAAPYILHELYGKAYERALPCLWILLPGTLALSAGKIASAHTSGEGAIWSTSWPVIVMFPLYCTALYFGLPHWGVVGAAWITSLNFSLISALLLLNYRGKTGRGLLNAFTPQRSDLRI